MSAIDDPVCHTSVSGTPLIGLTLVTQSGLLSMFADFALLCVLAAKVMKRKSMKGLFGTPYAIWILSLVIFDFIQGFGASLSIKWLAQESVDCSAYCTVQGTISLIGESASAIMTLVLAVYTYFNVIHRKSMHNLAWAWAIAAFIAVYVVLWGIIGTALHHNGDDSFEVPDQYWCWVGDKYAKERIPSEYLWLWLAAMASFLYIPLYLLFDRSSDPKEFPDYWKLLLYPIAYTIMVLPTSVTRWMFFRGIEISPLAQFLTAAVYQLTGFVNVLLLLYLRRSTALLEPEDGWEQNEGSVHAQGDVELDEIPQVDVPGGGLPSDP